MKAIKIEEKDHESFTVYTPKSETYAEAFHRLFSEEPYITELEQIVTETIEVVEAGKKSGNVTATVADRLIGAVQRFVLHVRDRNR